MPHPSQGRPRILDDAKQNQVCAIVGAGCALQVAAQYVGCSVLTLRREVLRNPAFKRKLSEARLQAQLAPLRAIRQAGDSQWRAAAWLLERTSPRQFSRPSPHGYNSDEVREIVDLLIDAATEETADYETRDRVCRRLLATAHHAFDKDALRRFRRAESMRKPTPMDQRHVQALLSGIDRSYDDAVSSLSRQTWNRSPAAADGSHAGESPQPGAA